MKNDPYIFAAFLKARDDEKWASDGTSPLVTISRQHGTGGDAIAERAAEILTEMGRGKEPWIVVDKNIAERVIEHHHLPKEISHVLSDKETVTIQDHIEGSLGISVAPGTVVERMTQTMVHLAKIGHVIFVGHGAHAVTARFPRAVHVRIIGSFERRVERLMERTKVSWDEAAAEIKQIDENRRHFVSTHFHVDINDMTGYDLIFNTDRISKDEAARLIAHLVSSPDFRQQQARQLTELRQQVLG